MEAAQIGRDSFSTKSVTFAHSNGGAEEII
jgi:hypothetical protein